MVDEKLARLRQQAEHCRRLALDLYDDRTISTLLKMAQEYDEAAEQVLEQQRQNRQGN
jgi:hypothetical protein